MLIFLAQCAFDPRHAYAPCNDVRHTSPWPFIAIAVSVIALVVVVLLVVKRRGNYEK